MIEETVMPRPRPMYLVCERSRHGKVRFAVRLPPDKDGKRRRIWLKGDYGSGPFLAAYRAAIAGLPLLHGAKSLRDKALGAAAEIGTLKWLINKYRAESAEWKGYSAETRRKRDIFFAQMIDTAGEVAAGDITRADIIATRDARAATPFLCKSFLDAVRALFAWAQALGHLEHDPAAGVKNLKIPKTGGFHCWTEDEAERYEAAYPLGSKERVWEAVLLYSGLRRSDAVRLGPQHRRDLIIDGEHVVVHVISLNKSGHTIEVTLPILPELQAALDAGPIGAETYIIGPKGRALTGAAFGMQFGFACKAAGVPGSAHGLRKLAATRAANNGATVHELKALFGWKDHQMPMHYTAEADRRRNAIGAIQLMANRRAGAAAPKKRGAVS